MPRPINKEDLLTASKENFEKLWKQVDSMSDKALNTPFDFLDEANKKEAHWKRDKNLRDILIHLYEWHQLLLNWVNQNQKGNEVAFLPKGYTWKNYGDMNVAFWEKHQTTSLDDATKMLQQSHNEVLELIEGFSTQELFTKQFFSWTGTTSLGSYCVSAMSSHYEWAIKKLRAHNKKCA